MQLQSWLQALATRISAFLHGRPKRSGHIPRTQCAPLLASERLEPRHLLSGVTLITHGHTDNTAEGGWVRAMGDAVMERALAQNPSASAFTEVQLTVGSSDGTTLEVTTAEVTSGSSVSLTSESHSGEIIVYLDWNAAQSATSSGNPYNTQFVADAIMPYLLGDAAITGLSAPLSEQPMHLLGHSRGGSLVGALAEGLGEAGVFVDQVTYLDPHPLAPGDYPVQNSAVPQNVLFADSVWRSDGNNWNEFWDADGTHIPGSYNNRLNENLLGGNDYYSNVGYFLEHLDVYLWYHGTIPDSETPTPNDGTLDAPLDWYGGLEPDRLESGFSHSRIAGGMRPATGLLDVDNPTTNRSTIDLSAAVWPSIFNLALSGDTDNLVIGELIETQFDYHENDSDPIVGFYFDADRNPYNGNELLTNEIYLSATGGATAGLTTDLNTAGLPAGTYYVSARLQDELGRTRYAYAPTAITLESDEHARRSAHHSR